MRNWTAKIDLEQAKQREGWTFSDPDYLVCDQCGYAITACEPPERPWSIGGQILTEGQYRTRLASMIQRHEESHQASHEAALSNSGTEVDGDEATAHDPGNLPFITQERYDELIDIAYDHAPVECSGCGVDLEDTEDDPCDCEGTDHDKAPWEWGIPASIFPPPNGWPQADPTNTGTEVDEIQQAARGKAERRFHEEGIARCWQVRDAWCKCEKPLDEFYYERPVSHLHGWACSRCYGITQTG